MIAPEPKSTLNRLQLHPSRTHYRSLRQTLPPRLSRSLSSTRVTLLTSSNWIKTWKVNSELTRSSRPRLWLSFGTSTVCPWMSRSCLVDDCLLGFRVPPTLNHMVEEPVSTWANFWVPPNRCHQGCRGRQASQNPRRLRNRPIIRAPARG